MAGDGVHHVAVYKLGFVLGSSGEVAQISGDGLGGIGMFSIGTKQCKFMSVDKFLVIIGSN